MKARLLEKLLGFSGLRPQMEVDPLFDELRKEWNWTSEEMQSKSKRVLRAILHHYSYLEISTLDRFAHRIVRTFSQDLKLPSNFEIVLDTEFILRETVQRLWAKLDQDPVLSTLLIDFSWEKIDQNKSWDVSRDLIKLGERLFKEEHRQQLDRLPNWSTAQWKEVEKEIDQARAQLGLELKRLGQECATHLDNPTLENAFGRYHKALLKNLGEGTPSLAKIQSKSFEALLQGNGGGKETLPTSVADHLQASLRHIEAGFWQDQLLENWKKSLPPLALLNAFKQEYKELCSEQNLIPLAEFNSLLSSQIKDQPAPYLFERLGTFYQHFLIDEFQDTSQLQWTNLLPLIAHPLEGTDEQGQKGSLLLVGDAKQAIYRWRGGHPEQFIDLIFGKSHPFQVEAEQLQLESNWRSAEEIVEFNNQFFTFLAESLDLTDHQSLFRDKSRQIAKRNFKGEVSLDLAPLFQGKAERMEWTLTSLNQRLRELVAEGVALEEICILTRTNTIARDVAQFLLEKGWPLVSQDALRIDDHPNVRLLYTLLHYLDNPENEEAVYTVLLALSSSAEDKHHFINHWRRNFKSFLQEQYHLDTTSLMQLELYDKCIALVTAFDLARDGQAYIAAFLEEVLTFESTHGNLLHAFLLYWEEAGPKKTLPTPEGVDALQLMTIHKSKGLEFKVVLFPFANHSSGRLHEQQIWVPTSFGSEELEKLPMYCNSEMRNYPPLVRAATEREWAQQQLDQINVLYVAFTRAAERLHLWSETTDKEPKGPQISLTYWLPQFLKQKGLWQDGPQRILWGNKVPTIQDQSRPVDRNSTSWVFQTPKISYTRFLKRPRPYMETPEAQRAIAWGNLMHQTLGKIQTVHDLEKALEHVLKDFRREIFDLDALERTLRKLLKDPRIKEFYKEGIEGYNEKEIISSQGELFRPDRLVLEGLNAHLLEFKTGQPKTEHHQQLLRYSELLSQMGFQPKTLALVYLQDSPEVVFL